MPQRPFVLVGQQCLADPQRSGGNLHPVWRVRGEIGGTRGRLGLAQQGVPVHGLVRAYRLGQRRMNELVFAEVQATDMGPMVKVAVLHEMSTTIFAYIDWMSQQVVDVRGRR
jgi:hypothetical protein